MVFKTYISKYNTVISGSRLNTGLNPISELVYGHDTIVSRGLLFFDHAKVKKLKDDGVMPDMGKMKHVLHITNAGSIDFTQLHDCETSSINESKKIRAASITNDSSTATVHPAAQCCWRFNPGSTNQGDWYLPSIGELVFIMPNFNDLQTAISDVSGVQLNDNNGYWSSTEYDGSYAWIVLTLGGGVNVDDKNGSTYVRAFLAL